MRMSKSQRRSRGFTLIAALLVMILLSAVAIGLVYMATNEGRMSANEQQDNVSYYQAESGMEKLTSDLASLYQTSLAPTAGQITALQYQTPSASLLGGYVNMQELITWPNSDGNGNPIGTWNTVHGGQNAGLYAEIVPLTLNVNATGPTGASVNITRNIEIALIPVFQFGVFCGYDCSFFAGPDFTFGGRVHTNGNLFLASGAHLVFNDKVAAFNQIVLDQLENNHATSAGYGGIVYVSSAAGGCVFNPIPPPTGAANNCFALSQTNPSPAGDASWSGGFPGVAGGSNGTNYSSFLSAAGAFNGYLTTSVNGATNMQLQFVQNSCTSNPPPCTDPIQIIRKPVVGESSSSSVGQSRLYNKAQIRVLLADTQNDLHPERGLLGDGQDVQFTLPNPGANALQPNFANVGGANQFFAEADTTVAGANWVAPINPATGVAYANWTRWPLLGALTTNPPDSRIPNTAAGYSGQGAWIRIEYLNNVTNTWTGVTTEWLGYGFGKAYDAFLNAPGGNVVNPNAILILQQLRPLPLPQTQASAWGPATNWYPINFYDAREGEERDTVASGCTLNGVMNGVELDVGNLAAWLAHVGGGPYAGGQGNLVNFTSQNGYLLYFSDRRGMLGDPNHGGLTYGESGLEDVVNAGSAAGTPDGALEPTTDYGYSPEDVDLNGVLDNWGGKNIGFGLAVNTSVAPFNPYQLVPGSAAACGATAAANGVSGARHGLKLVDAGMDNTGKTYLPMRTDTNPKSGGFTVASENPVYVVGNYNSSVNDPFWLNNAANNTLHAAASIVADTVSVLSNYVDVNNGWSDAKSFANPTAMTNRNAVPTYYRMAVAGGKNIPFPQPAWGGNDMGTDGGMHNFLRYLEDWGGQTVYYNGSLVNMYYSEYNTGIFKCCTTVYNAPTRKFYFDTLFLQYQNLPPGTPEFQDIDNLSYQQNFKPQ